jgi:hypothetical protein
MTILDKIKESGILDKMKESGILDKMKDTIKDSVHKFDTVEPNSPKQTGASVRAPTVPTVVTDTADTADAADEDDALVNQISNLQKLENDKYIVLNGLLKSNPSPDNVAQQKTIINDIKEIATIRSKLFDTMLSNASSNLKVTQQMGSTLEARKAIVTLKETALGEQRAALQAAAAIIDDSRRMVGINTYYDKQYEARIKIMKFIVLICFIIIFLIVLLHLGWLPQELVTVLVVVTLFGGLFYAGSLINDMYQRSNINFDEYDFEIDSNMGSKLSQKIPATSTASSDRTCSSSLYSSIASTAAEIEDSISSKATLLKNELTGTPDPSQSSSSLSASGSAHAFGTTLPSVESKLSESFLPLMSRMDRRQFNSNDAQQPMAYDSENSYGKI